MVLDSGWLILNEYKRNWRSNPQFAGTKFLKWLLVNLNNTRCCEQLDIHANGFSFDEFPNHPDLGTFDRDGRKFVAVSLAHFSRPPIVQAVDSDWLHARDTLLACGVTVEFLCEQQA